MAHLTNASASSSTSTAAPPNTILSSCYDVFLNHHGEDVNKSFASHLYSRLISHGLRVFLDNPEMQPGDILTSHIRGAIATASVHIAIFSPRYAESKRCLEELVLMLESKGIIIPVFYQVLPSALRWTRDEIEVYGQTLCNLEKMTTKDPQTNEEKPLHERNTIERWRKALKDVSEIRGFDLQACNGDEVELMDKVMKQTLLKVPRLLYVAKYPTALNEKVADIERIVLLQKQQHIGEAKVVGILGLGGLGKTTVAREFFNRKRSDYERSCFLSDVRENAARGSLKSLQSKLIRDLTGQDIIIDTLHHGKESLTKHLSDVQAAIVFDDVDHVDQLDALLSPVKNVLNSHSLIVVTSRDKNVLISSGIEESSIYRLSGLNGKQSEELFCMYAFGQPHSIDGFEEVVKGFLNACDGLPLSLKVLGAFLCGKGLGYWEDQLHKLNRVIPSDIQQRLQISYDALDKEEKEIFLDIACFFIGEDRDKAIRIWDASCCNGRLSLRILENRCLVEIDNKNCLRMHDLVRDLGRDLEDKRPEGRSCRFWRPIDNFDLHNVFQHQTSVRGISRVQRRPGQDPVKELCKRFENLTLSNRFPDNSGLQLLRAEGDSLGSIYNLLRRSDLQWLCWDKYPYTFLPCWIPKMNLRVLEVGGDELETLWQNETEAPLQLRELSIGAVLLRVPESIGLLKHLEKIVLKDTIEPLPEGFFHLHSLRHMRIRTKMMVLPDSLGSLTKLQHIDFSESADLKTLPDSLGSLTELQHIDFSGCADLKTLPDSLGSLTKLQHIDFSGCADLKTLPQSMGNLINLQYINLKKCFRLQMLPDSFCNLIELRHLSLECCDNLKELPFAIGNLCKLEILKLQCPLLETLPSSLGNLTSIQELTLHFCTNLKCLPDSVGRLKHLTALTIHYADIEYLPEALTELNNLRTLKVRACPRLLKVPLGTVEKVGLPDSSIEHCMFRLEHLDVQGTAIRELSFPDGFCPTLRLLNTSFCLELVEIGALPTTLISLDVQGCSSLEKIRGLSALAKLELLDITGCSEIEELPGLETLSSLELRADGCDKLKGVGKNLMNIRRKSCNVHHFLGLKKRKL